MKYCPFRDGECNYTCALFTDDGRCTFRVITDGIISIVDDVRDGLEEIKDAIRDID